MYEALFTIHVWGDTSVLFSIENVVLIINNNEVTMEMIEYLSDVYCCGGKYTVTVDHVCINKK